MSTTEPSFLGHAPKEQAEHPGERAGVLGRTAAALDVLSCFDSLATDGDRRSTHCADEIARATERSRGEVDRQLALLTRLGYLEGVSGSRFRLSRRMPGGAEIAAVSARHFRRNVSRHTEEDGGAGGTSL